MCPREIRQACPQAVGQLTGIFAVADSRLSHLRRVYSDLCSLLIACVNAGMLDLKHAQEWVVTTKLGSSDKRPGTQMPTVPVRTCRFYAAEMVFSFFVLASASYGIFSVNKWSFSICLTLQGGQFVSTTFLAFTSCIKPADLSDTKNTELHTTPEGVHFHH